jgi:hypothetical protein
MAFDKKLLDILACPSCKGKLHYLSAEQAEQKAPGVAEGAVLVCRFDRLVYPIRENIPVLLETQAKPISVEELEQLKK